MQFLINKAFVSIVSQIYLHVDFGEEPDDYWHWGAGQELRAFLN
jgi:hypothetical protein